MDLSDNRSWNVGSVTSVGLSLPDVFSVSGSPITTNGILEVSLVSQTANTILAAPDGEDNSPSFRSLVSTDIPSLDWAKITTGKPTTLSGYGITDAAGLNLSNTFNLGPQNILTGNSGNKGLIVRGSPSQTVNLQELQGSD
ncbi:hypothetical protein MEO41_28225, partial [Dolichospermum sp. ST_sed4]|nr:hypothetical protein [Dolichospermum sp. ST_sed4]